MSEQVEIEHGIDDLVLVPSLYCSMTCAHCCRAAGPWRKERMSAEVANRVRYWMTVCEVKSVTVSGGEPFLMGKALWARVLDALPWDMESIFIVTNGDFLSRPRAYHRVLHYVLPELSRHLASKPNLGIGLSVSGDQYHDGYNQRKWEWFKDTLRNPWDEAKGDDDPIWRLAELEWDVSIGANARGYIGRDRLIPTGRARWLTEGDSENYMYCELNDYKVGSEDAVHTVTVYPDGAIKACCNGGPTIGTIFEDPEFVLQRHLDFVLTLRERYGTRESWDAKDRTPGQVSTRTCYEHCRRVAREFYKPERNQP